MNIDLFDRNGFVERLELIRTKNGLSKGEFAEKIQVKDAIGRYKSGYIKFPSAETLLRISSIFNVSVDWLLNGKESQPEKPISGLEDLDQFLDAARERAASDPSFAGWLLFELKKALE